MALSDGLISARVLNAVGPATGFRLASLPSQFARLNGAGAFSVSIWAKYLSGTNIICLAAQSSIGKNFRLLNLGANNTDKGIQWNWTVSSGQNLSATLTNRPVAVDGSYHLHTLTYDGATRLIYIDSTQISSLSASGFTQSNEASPGEQIAALGCEVASVILWDRAITAAEVAEIVSAGTDLSVFSVGGSAVAGFTGIRGISRSLGT